MSSWKRGFLEIIGEILENLMSNPLKKTHITFRCNLDSRAVTKYLQIMQQVGLVQRVENDQSLYRITEKGVKYRNQFNSFVGMMESDFENIPDYKKDPKTLLENLKIKISN
ncbi:MAG: winged helix-turn-helix domain-containing protein [Nitrosopumilaceae archaeon]